MDVHTSFKQLHKKISDKSAKVGVVGLGYVGLPTSYYIGEKGFTVTGFDLSEDKVKMIHQGISYLKDLTNQDIVYMTEMNKFKATSNLSLLAEMDIILICVPTPIDEHKNPDLIYVKNAAKTIAKHISHSSLVILESTTYPGTTEEHVVPFFEQNGFQIGKDVFIAYSPERIDPGNTSYGLENTPKVVGGITKNCTNLASIFFGPNSYPVSHVRVAEMSKIFENSFRFVNLGFVNETAVLCNKMGIDIWEVIEASGTKPYGFMKFKPGIGVGGHCIPVDPYYLTFKAREFDERTKMIELAGELNDQMVQYTYFRLMELLNNKGILIKDAKIVVLGITYKENMNDIRESPVLRLLNKLANKPKQLYVIEPYASEEQFLQIENCKIVSYKKEVIQEADLVIIATPHELFPYQEIVQEAALIFDTKDVMTQKEIYSPKVVKL